MGSSDRGEIGVGASQKREGSQLLNAWSVSTDKGLRSLPRFDGKQPTVPLLDVSGTIAGSQEFLDPFHVGMANAIGA